MRSVGPQDVREASKEAEHRHEHWSIDTFGGPRSQNDILGWTSKYTISPAFGLDEAVEMASDPARQLP